VAFSFVGLVSYSIGVLPMRWDHVGNRARIRNVHTLSPMHWETRKHTHVCKPVFLAHCLDLSSELYQVCAVEKWLDDGVNLGRGAPAVAAPPEFRFVQVTLAHLAHVLKHDVDGECKSLRTRGPTHLDCGLALFGSRAAKTLGER